jgi:hypothetical protein
MAIQSTATPKKWYQKFDYKDALALIGLGLLGWGLHRAGGRTLLIFFLSFLALAFSGLLHVVVVYVELHVINTIRSIITKVEKPFEPKAE